jgi:hypothetical protein
MEVPRALPVGLHSLIELSSSKAPPAGLVSGAGPRKPFDITNERLIVAREGKNDKYHMNILESLEEV